MKPRTRPRTSVSIGSNQLSKSWTAVSFWGCEGSGFVVTLVMAWSPVRRFNAGRFEVDHPGDYATFNSNQPCYDTHAQLKRQKTVWETVRGAQPQPYCFQIATLKGAIKKLKVPS